MDLSKLTPEQHQAVMAQAQNNANMQLTQVMIEKMTESCFKKCAGTSVSFLPFSRVCVFVSIRIATFDEGDGQTWP